MQGGTLQTLYILAAVAGAAVLSLRSRAGHKVVAFLLSFWILGGSVIREPRFNLRIPRLGGEIEVHELLFFALFACFFVLAFVGARNSPRTESLPFQKYFYLFLGWFLIVIIYHLADGSLAFRDFRSIGEGTAIVLLLYLILRRHADEEMVRVLWRSVVLVAAASSVVALIQSFVNHDFLRIGLSRMAFGSTERSSGVYSAEYLHAYVLVFALIIVLVAVESGRLRVFLVSLFLFGILLSFHRMSWIVTLVVVGVYLVRERRISLTKIAFAVGMVLFVTYFITTVFTSLPGQVEGTELYRQRLGANTLSSRIQIVEMILSRVDKILVWGAGSLKSDLYYHGMLSIGQTSDWALGQKGGLHNLYLETLFFYGMPALILFCIMLLSMVAGFRNLHRLQGSFFLVPLLFVLMYALMNLTNSFPWHREFGFFLGIVLGCSAWVASRRPASEFGKEEVPA